VRSLLVLGLEEPRARLEQSRAVALADLVADLRSGEGADERAEGDGEDVQAVLVVGRGKESGGEEERIPW